MATYEWFRHFKNGRTSTDDDERPGRHSTSRSEPLIAQVKNIVRGNRRLTVREVSEDVRVPLVNATLLNGRFRNASGS
jgi:hypothetical protein